MQNSIKKALRKKIGELLQQTTAENRAAQSKEITQKILNHAAFQQAKRVSIYLSTEFEVDTLDIIRKMFQDNKEVFVPTYEGKKMKMVKLFDMDDYESLPLTKWNIKQPNPDDVNRENPILTAPLDLILLPGVAFNRTGGRMGHGMGYYDKYLHSYFNRYPDKAGINKTHLFALAFKEQIVDADQLPIDPNDYLLDGVVTSD